GSWKKTRGGRCSKTIVPDSLRESIDRDVDGTTRLLVSKLDRKGVLLLGSDPGNGYGMSGRVEGQPWRRSCSIKDSYPFNLHSPAFVGFRSGEELMRSNSRTRSFLRRRTRVRLLLRLLLRPWFGGAII